MPTSKIDTFNQWGIGSMERTNEGPTLVIALPPRYLTPNEALRFAAYCVLMAEHAADHTFADVLAAVGNT